jgi:hypothetical protein
MGIPELDSEHLNSVIENVLSCCDVRFRRGILLPGIKVEPLLSVS